LLVSGASYGAVGAIYKPEIDNGVIVTSVGGTAGHPASFTVNAKDGSKSSYGVDAAQRLCERYCGVAPNKSSYVLAYFRI
jgi:hypothetical protein